MKTVLNLAFLFLIAQTVNGQNTTASILSTPTSTADISNKKIDWANFEKELAKEENSDWSFHTDQSSKLLYIDFETLGGKMNRLVLKSANKVIVIEDNRLFDLPVNTIYEVNLEKLERGSYFVELFTYDEKIICEEITIN